MFNWSKSEIAIPVIVVGLVFAILITPMLATVPVAAQGDQQLTNAEEERLWALGEPIGLFGPINYSDGVASGKFVQFVFSENESIISNYTVNTGTNKTTIFSEMNFTGLGLNPNTSVTGPLFQIMGNTTAVLIHNNPTALIQVVSVEKGDEVSIALAEGMDLVEDQPMEGSVLNLTGNGINGTLLIYNGTASQVPGNDTKPPSILVSFDQDGAMQFRCSPKVGNSSESNEAAIQSTFSRAELGGEVWVTVNGSNYIYEDATINGITPHVETASNGEVRMQVNSTPNGTGKLVLANIDNKVIDPKGNVSVVFNNESVTNASSLASVINSTQGNASFFALSAGNITKYLIYLPAFQENNTLVITTASNSSVASTSEAQGSITPRLLVASTLSVTSFLTVFRT